VPSPAFQRAPHCVRERGRIAWTTNIIRLFRESGNRRRDRRSPHGAGPRSNAALASTIVGTNHDIGGRYRRNEITRWMEPDVPSNGNPESRRERGFFDGRPRSTLVVSNHCEHRFGSELRHRSNGKVESLVWAQLTREENNFPVIASPPFAPSRDRSWIRVGNELEERRDIRATAEEPHRNGVGFRKNNCRVSHANGVSQNEP